MGGTSYVLIVRGGTYFGNVLFQQDDIKKYKYVKLLTAQEYITKYPNMTFPQSYGTNATTISVNYNNNGTTYTTTSLSTSAPLNLSSLSLTSGLCIDFSSTLSAQNQYFILEFYN